MITFNITDGRISGSVDKKTFSVPFSKDLWESMKATQKDLDRVKTYQEAKEVAAKFEKLTITSLAQAAEEITPNLCYKADTKTYHFQHKGRVHPHKLPAKLVEDFKNAHAKGYPVEPLVLYTIKQLMNHLVQDPKKGAAFFELIYNYISQTYVCTELRDEFVKQGKSLEVANELATVRQNPITADGNVVFKKVVKVHTNLMRYSYTSDGELGVKKVLKDPSLMKVDPDTGAISWENPKVAEDYIFLPAIQGTGGDAFYCGKELGHIIKVGEIIYLERWDQVDCNSNHFCVKGLHVGNEDYIRGWQNGAGCITLNVVVHPMDIGAISNGESVARVKRYQVLSVKSPEIENRNFYHTSVLTELAQKEYKVNIEEMLNAQDERMAKLQKELEHEKSFIINDIA